MLDCCDHHACMHAHLLLLYMHGILSRSGLICSNLNTGAEWLYTKSCSSVHHR